MVSNHIGTNQNWRDLGGNTVIPQHMHLTTIGISWDFHVSIEVSWTFTLNAFVYGSAKRSKMWIYIHYSIVVDVTSQG